MKELKRFQEIAENPNAYAKEWKKKNNGIVIGYFCSYTPEEIISASGALPFRIFGTKENIALADSHLQTYCCSLVRGGLEEALNGNLDFIEGTAFPHTCDSIQRLSDIWRLNAGKKHHFDLVLPVKLDTESSREYFYHVFNKFKSDIESSYGLKISNEDLDNSISLFNSNRELMMDLYRIRSTDPKVITGSDFYSIIKSSMVMDRKEFNELLGNVIIGIKQENTNLTEFNGKRIMLAGGICNHPNIYTLIEESGGAVVWDDLCTGTRIYEGVIENTGDPVTAISKRYIERIVCPAKHSSVTARGDNILKLANDQNVDGVIFLFLKFCDPQSFDYPYLKEFLDEKKIPNMLLEVEEQLPPEGQLRTRFETFIEMI